MMSLILGWLWSNKNLVAVGLAALAIGMYILGLKYQIGSRDKTIASQYAQIADLNTSIASEQAHSKLLEERIKNMIADGVRRKKNADMWREKFSESEKHRREAVGGLLSWQAKPNESDCDAAKRLIREFKR